MDTAVRHTLTNLLGGYGYNLYEKKNRARADDLLVRERAADALAEAENALRTLQQSYRQRFLPPLTRDNPDPPRDRLDALSRMARFQQRLDALEAQIHGMVVPTQDRVWEKFRSEAPTLQQLLQLDHDLIAPCEALREAVRQLDAEGWNDESATRLESMGTDIERAARARADFLKVPR